MDIRDARLSEAGTLAEVFYRSVREGAVGPYSPAQCEAWAPQRPTADHWAARIAGLETVLAERDGRIVGFMSLNPGDGDLDLAYVLPEVKGTGVARSLYAVLENRARSRGLTRLHTHASHLAKPFFTAQGWRVDRANRIDRSGVTLDNWIMSKRLS